MNSIETTRDATTNVAERAIARFSKLPGEAVVPGATAAAVLSMGISTLRRLAKTDPRLLPVRTGPRMVRFKVSGIRAFLQGQPK